MEDNQELKKGDLLLYIHQPELKEPGKKVMQEYYYFSPKDQVEPAIPNIELDLLDAEPAKPDNELDLLDAEPAPTVKEVRPKAKISKPTEIFLDLQEEKENQLVDEGPSVSAADYFRKNAGPARPESTIARFRPVKSFRNMSIEEKIHYLAGFPVSQPPFPCEFITNVEQIGEL